MVLQAARTRFSPEERDCYFQEELPLLFLPAKFYRYEMSNCLFEAAYEEVEIVSEGVLIAACWNSIFYTYQLCSYRFTGIKIKSNQKLILS